MRSTPVRRRKRGFLALAIGAASLAYLAYHAVYGAHGLTERDRLVALEQSLVAQRDALIDERSGYERRIDLLRSDRIDPDMLDERARFLLGFVDPGDRILILPD